MTLRGSRGARSLSGQKVTSTASMGGLPPGRDYGRVGRGGEKLRVTVSSRFLLKKTRLTRSPRSVGAEFQVSL